NGCAGAAPSPGAVLDSRPGPVLRRMAGYPGFHSRPVGDPPSMNPDPIELPDETEGAVDLSSATTATHPVAPTSTSVAVSEAPPRGDPVPGERLGPYRLVRELGAGGMGLVF